MAESALNQRAVSLGQYKVVSDALTTHCTRRSAAMACAMAGMAHARLLGLCLRVFAPLGCIWGRGLTLCSCAGAAEGCCCRGQPADCSKRVHVLPVAVICRPGLADDWAAPPGRRPQHSYPAGPCSASTAVSSRLRAHVIRVYARQGPSVQHCCLPPALWLLLQLPQGLGQRRRLVLCNFAVSTGFCGRRRLSGRHPAPVLAAGLPSSMGMPPDTKPQHQRPRQWSGWLFEQLQTAWASSAPG